MIKRVMIRLCGYLSGVSVCALHILFCSRLFGWVATLVIVGVQLGIAGWIVYMREYVLPIRKRFQPVQLQDTPLCPVDYVSLKDKIK